MQVGGRQKSQKCQKLAASLRLQLDQDFFHWFCRWFFWKLISDQAIIPTHTTEEHTIEELTLNNNTLEFLCASEGHKNSYNSQNFVLLKLIFIDFIYGLIHKSVYGHP